MIETTLPQTLLGLVEHYSPTHHEDKAVAFLVERMQCLGYERAYVDPAGNAIGVIGQGSHQIVLLGHIDTVPGEIPPHREGDLFYGRGSVDAKGALAAFVDAAIAVKVPEGWQIIVVGAVGEEGDSRGARYIVDHYRPDFAIIGEPSHWNRITLGYKGALWVEMSIRRPVAHSAGQIESACQTAVSTWLDIQQWANEFNLEKERLFDQVTPSLRQMSSGTDGFEDWAQLQIGVRLPSEISPEACTVQIQHLASQRGAQIKSGGHPVPACKAEKNTALVRAMLAGIRLLGGQPGFVLKSGTADMNIVAPVWNCPIVAYGPGDSELDHTPNEHISLEEYAQAVETLNIVLQNLM